MQTVSLDDVRIAHALDQERGPDGVTLRRLPAWTRPQIPDLAFGAMIPMPAGVRLEFVTDSTEIETQGAAHAHRSGRADVARRGVRARHRRRGRGRRRHRRGHRISYDPTTMLAGFTPGEPATARFTGLDSTAEHHEIWLPHHCAVEIRALRVADGSSVTPRHDDRRRWVHYGSSISHCLEATHPTQTWPAIAARLADVDLHNLAFAGQCQLDPFTARTIRDISADLISLKLGINIVNADSMRERTFAPAIHGFLDTIREGHPTTPLLVITPIICPAVETSPGPTMSTPGGKIRVPDRSDELSVGALSLERIRTILADIVAVRDMPPVTRTSTSSTVSPCSAPTTSTTSRTGSIPTQRVVVGRESSSTRWRSPPVRCSPTDDPSGCDDLFVTADVTSLAEDLDAQPDHPHVELLREGCTMALYVAVCLLAGLTVASDQHVEELNVVAVVWGTTLGLAIAHWFAFRMSSRLAAGGRVRRRDVEVSAAQLGGAAAVGVLATIPVVLFSESNELDAVRLVLAGFVGVVGFTVARSSGASKPRAGSTRRQW